MPTFDYECTACGKVFEAKRRFGEDTNQANCPEDGADAKRLFSPPLDMIVYGNGYNTRVPPPASTPTTGGSFGHSHGPGGHTHSHGPGTHTH